MGPPEVIEGAWPGAIVLMAFPDREAATRWYKFPEYQAILPLRTSNSIADPVFIDQLTEDFTVKAWAAIVRKDTAAKRVGAISK